MTVTYIDHYGVSRSVDFDAAVSMMDDDLRERVHSMFIGGEVDDPQSFMDVYCTLHYDVYGEVFEV